MMTTLHSSPNRSRAGRQWSSSSRRRQPWLGTLCCWLVWTLAGCDAQGPTTAAKPATAPAAKASERSAPSGDAAATVVPATSTADPSRDATSPSKLVDPAAHDKTAEAASRSAHDAAISKEGSEPNQATPNKSDSAKSEQNAESRPTGEGTAESSSKESSSKEETADGSAKDASKPPAGERIVLLTAGSPLLIELNITLDGRSPGASFAEVVATLLASSDQDKDGRTTWDELAQNPAIQRGLYGNMPINSPQELTQFIEQYDLNDNHVVDGDELPRIFSAGGRAGRAVFVRNLLENREWNRTRSPLFLTLDRDASGTLNGDECQAIASILKSLDTDDDERLQPYELTAAPPPGMNDAMSMRRRSLGPNFAWRVTDRTNWDALLRAFQETYALGGLLTPNCFAARPQLFTRLDLNANGYISSAELEKLLELPADVVAEIAWGRAENPGWTLHHVSDELGRREAVVAALPEGAILQLPGAQIELFQRGDTVSADDQARQILMTYDANQNAYLDGEELAPALAALNTAPDLVDTNADEEIPFDELAAYFRRQSAAASSQVQIQASHREDALWTFLDANRDGQLDGQELQRAADGRLMQLDRDKSGDITWEELPDAVVVAIVRGAASDAPLRPQPILAAAAAEAADWFQFMDANRDGTISRREFLGDAAQFNALDADRDGRLTWGESGAKR